MAAVHVTAYPVYNGGARDDDDDVIGIDFRAGQATQLHDDCSPRSERTPKSRRCVAVTIDVRVGRRYNGVADSRTHRIFNNNEQ